MSRWAGWLSQRATTTFCWLPPDRVDMESVGVRQTMPSSPICFAGDVALRPMCQHAEVRVARQEGQRDIAGDVEVRDDAVDAAVLGREEDAAGDGIAGRFGRIGLAVEFHRAGNRLADAEQGLGQHRLADADQAGDGDDLAGVPSCH